MPQEDIKQCLHPVRGDGICPGDEGCTEKILNHHLNKPNACPGTNGCVSSLKQHPQADPAIAAACKEEPGTALRRLGHFKRLAERAARVNVDLLGSTGEGLGHLSDARAVSRSIVPQEHLGIPPALAAETPCPPNFAA